jgi:pantoate kinase
MDNYFKVYVPARISGFFEVIYKYDKSFKTLFASTGAGINLQLGGYTSLNLIKDGNRKIKIYINGKKESNPITSKNVLKLLLPKNFIDSLEIFHDFEVPVGCGYGASGMGALGLTMALNRILDLNLDKNKIGEIAHKAEVISKTGLGTVGPQLLGGLTITKKAGPPGQSIIQNIPLSDEYKVITASFGPIETKKILSDEILVEKINLFGKESLQKIIADPNLKTFLKISRFFAEDTGLISKRLKEVILELDKIDNVISSMCMVGQSLFTIVKEEQIPMIINVLKSFFTSNEIFISKINNSGAIII